MAREVTHRREIRGELFTESPILIGGPATPGADVTPLRDGADRIIIPGTSLAGVLRHWAVTCGCTDFEVKALFGDASPDSTSGVGASPLVVFDLVAEQPPNLSIRDGVGIDRISGTAAEHVKFDQTVVDVNACFTLEMRVDVAVDDPDVHPVAFALLDQLVNAMMEGQIRLGRGSTRSLGCVRLREVKKRTINLRDRNQVLALARGEEFISGEARWDEFKTGSSGHQLGSAGPITVVWWWWEPTTPVISAEALTNGAVDLIPRTRIRSLNDYEFLELVLPGTSIKGVLRSTSEFILRSLRKEHAPPRFQDQLDYPPIATLFGGTGRRSAISVDDVYSCPVFRLKISDDGKDGKGSLEQRWEKALADRDKDESRLKTLRTALDRLAEDPKEAAEGDTYSARLIPSARVAINRWTSAPVDGALYSILEPYGVTWEPIRIGVDTTMLQAPWSVDALAALLLLVIDRIDDEQVSLGFGGQRGLGGFRIKTIHVDERDFTKHDKTSLSESENRSNELFARVLKRDDGSGASLTLLSEDDRAALRKSLNQIIEYSWKKQ